jgi:hypothetical protein
MIRTSSILGSYANALPLHSELVADDLVSDELWHVRTHNDTVVALNNEVVDIRDYRACVLVNGFVLDESSQLLVRRGLQAAVYAQLAPGGAIVVNLEIVIA